MGRAKGERRTGEDEPQRRSKVVYGLIVAALVLFAGFEWYRHRMRPAAVLPARPEAMEAAVARIVQERIDAANADPSNAERHGDLGLAYEANELYPEAIACFELAERLDPDDPVWAHHAAIALVENGQLDAALERLRTIVTRHPDYAPSLHRLGLLAVESGDFEDAERVFRRTVSLLPEAPEGYVGLAQVALAREQYADALQLLERARALDPGYDRIHFFRGQAYRGLGRMDEAERELQLGLEASVRHVPDRLSQRTLQLAGGLASQLARGAKLIEAGRAAEAVVLLEQALRERPDDVNVLNNLAVACIEAEKLDRAVEILERIRAADPGAFPTYINLAACQLRMARAADALPNAERAVALAPHVAQAHFVLGQSQRALDRPLEAIAALEKAVELDRKNPAIDVELADAYLMVGRTADARAQVERVTRMAPNLLPGHVKLGEICVLQGDLAGAEAALARAHELKADGAGVPELAQEVARLRRR